MKRFLITMLGIVIIAAVAFAASEKTDPDGSVFPHWFKAGIYVGPANTKNPTTSTANKVTGFYAPSAAQTIDIGSTATLTCTDSAAFTVTGAKVGDPCLVGLPAANPATSDGNWSCAVTATDQVKLRYCNQSAGSLDPASAVFNFRVISNQ